MKVSHLLEHLTRIGVAHPPAWLNDNLAYLTVTGSQAYGCADDDSDLDIYGFAVPPKEEVFPHLRGEIVGFGKAGPRFEQWQQHHMKDTAARGGRGQQYDVTVFSIVKFFQLAMENNPNMLDPLFTPDDCVLHATPVAELVRMNRRRFLHRGAYQKFKGYAASQLAKLKTKQPEAGSRRAALVEQHGYDVKYAMHLCRLLIECEQILTEGDLDLRRRSDFLRLVRSGTLHENFVLDWAERKGASLDALYRTTTVVPAVADEAEIKRLLEECLDQHYTAAAV